MSEHDLSKYKDDELDLLETLTKPGSTYAKKNGRKARSRLARIKREKAIREKAKDEAEGKRARAIAEKTRNIGNLKDAQLRLVAKHHAKWLRTAKEAVEWLRSVTPVGLADYDSDVAVDLFAKHHPEDLVRWARNNPEDGEEGPVEAQLAMGLESATPVVTIRWTDRGQDAEDETPVMLKYRQPLNIDGACSLAIMITEQKPLGIVGLARLARSTQRIVWTGDRKDSLGRIITPHHREGDLLLDVRVPLKDTSCIVRVDGKYAPFFNSDECYTCADGCSLACDECSGHFKACRSFDAVGFMLINRLPPAANPAEFVEKYGARYNADRRARDLPVLDLDEHAVPRESDSDDDSDSGSVSELSSGPSSDEYSESD